MNYRIGWPFWKLAAKLGCTLTFRVIIHHDHDEENPNEWYYWSESPDLPLVLCMKTIPELLNEIKITSEELLEDELQQKAKSKAYLDNNLEQLI